MRKLKKSLKLIISLISVFVLAVATVVAVVVVSNLRKKGDDGDNNPSYALTAEQKALVSEIGGGVGSYISSGKKSAVLYSSKYSKLNESVSDWDYFDESVAYSSYGDGIDKAFRVYVFDANDNNKFLHDIIKEKCSLTDVSTENIVVVDAVNNHFVVRIKTGETTYSFVVCTVKNYDVFINKMIDGVSDEGDLMLNGSQFACRVQEKFFMILIDNNTNVEQSDLAFEFYEYLDSYDGYEAYSYKPESFVGYTLQGNTFSIGSVKISLQSYGFALSNTNDLESSADLNKTFIGNYVLVETRQSSSASNTKSVLVDQNYYTFAYTLAHKTAQNNTSSVSLGDFSKASIVYNSNNYFALFMQKSDANHALTTNGELVYFDYSLNEIARLAVKDKDIKIIYSDGTYVLTSQGLFAGKKSKTLNLVFDFSAKSLTYNQVLPSGNFLLKDGDNNFYIYNFNQDVTVGSIEEIVAYLDDNSMIFKKNGGYYIYYFSTKTVSQKINYVTSSLAENTSLFLAENDDDTYNLNTSKTTIETNIKTYDLGSNNIVLNFGEGATASTKTYYFKYADVSGVSGVSFSDESKISTGSSSEFTFGDATGSEPTPTEVVDWYEYGDSYKAWPYPDSKYDLTTGLGYLHEDVVFVHYITDGVYSNTVYYDYLEINYGVRNGYNYAPLRLYYSIVVDQNGNISFGFGGVSGAKSLFDHYTMACIDLGDGSSDSARELMATYRRYVIEDNGKFYIKMPICDNTDMSRFSVREKQRDGSIRYYDLASYGSSLASVNSFDYELNNNYYYYFTGNPTRDYLGNFVRGFKINSVYCEVYGESIRVQFSFEFKYQQNTFVDRNGNDALWDALNVQQDIAGFLKSNFGYNFSNEAIDNCDLFFTLLDGRSTDGTNRYVLSEIGEFDIDLDDPDYYNDFYIVPVLVGIDKSTKIEYSNLINFKHTYGSNTSDDIISNDFVSQVLGNLDYSIMGDYIATGKTYELFTTGEGDDEESNIVHSIYNYYVTNKTKYTDGLSDFSNIYTGNIATTITGGQLIGFTSLTQTGYTNITSDSLYDTDQGTYYEDMLAVNLKGDNGNPNKNYGSLLCLSWNYIGDGYIYNTYVDADTGKTESYLQYRSGQSIYIDGYFNTFRYIYCVYEPVEIDFTIDYNIGSTGQSKKDSNSENKTAWGEINYLTNYAGLTIGNKNYQNYYTKYQNTRAHLLDEESFSRIDTVITYEDNGEEVSYENFIKYATVDFLQDFTRLSGNSDQVLHYVKEAHGDYHLVLSSSDYPYEYVDFGFLYDYDYTDGYKKVYSADESADEGEGFYYFWVDSDYYFLAYRNNDEVYVFYNSYEAVEAYVQAERNREQKAVVKQEVYESEVLTFIEIDGVRYYFQRNAFYETQSKDGDGNYLYEDQSGNVSTSGSPDEALMEIVCANLSYKNLKNGNYYFIATSDANAFYEGSTTNAENSGDGNYVINDLVMGDNASMILNKYKYLAKLFKSNNKILSSSAEESRIGLSSGYGATFCLGRGDSSLGYKLYNQFFPQMLNLEGADAVFNETFAEVQDNFYYTRGDSQLLIRFAYDSDDGVFYAYYHESETHTRDAEYKGYWSWEYNFELDNTNGKEDDKLSLKINYNDHGYSEVLENSAVNYDIKVAETFKYLYTDGITFTSVPTHEHYTFLGYDIYLVGNINYQNTVFKTINFRNFDTVNGISIDTTELIKEYIDREGEYPEFTGIKFVARWQPITISIKAVMWTTETKGSDKTYIGNSYSLNSESKEYEKGKTVLSTNSQPGFMIGASEIVINEENVSDSDETRGVVDLELSLEYNPFLTYEDLGKAMEDNNYTTANISVTGLDSMLAGWGVEFESKVIKDGDASGSEETESDETEREIKFISGLYGVDDIVKSIKLGTMAGFSVYLEAIYTDAPYDFDLYFNPMGGAQNINEPVKKADWMNDDPIAVNYDIEITPTTSGSNASTFKYTTRKGVEDATLLEVWGDNTNYSTLFTNSFSSGSSVRVAISFENDYYYFRKIVINNIILKNDENKYEKYTITFLYTITKNTGEDPNNSDNGIWSAIAVGESNTQLEVSTDDNGEFIFGTKDYNKDNNNFRIESSVVDGKKTTVLTVSKLSWPGTLNYESQQIARGRGFTAEFYPASYTIDNETVDVKSFDDEGNTATEVINLNRSSIVSAQPLTNISGNQIKSGESAYVWLNTSKYCFAKNWYANSKRSGYYRIYSIGTVEAVLIGDYTYEMFVTQDNQPNADIYVYYDARTDLIYYLAETQMEYYALIENMTDLEKDAKGYYCLISYPSSSNPDVTVTSKYYAYYRGSRCETLPANNDDLVGSYLLFMREDTIVNGVGYESLDYGKEIYSKSCYANGATSFYGYVQKISVFVSGRNPEYRISYYKKSTNEALIDVESETNDQGSGFVSNRYIILDSTKYYLTRNLRIQSAVANERFKAGIVFKAVNINQLYNESTGLNDSHQGWGRDERSYESDDNYYVKGCASFYVTICSVSDTSITVKYKKNFEYSYDEVPVVNSSNEGKELYNKPYNDNRPTFSANYYSDVLYVKIANWSQFYTALKNCYNDRSITNRVYAYVKDANNKQHSCYTGYATSDPKAEIHFSKENNCITVTIEFIGFYYSNYTYYLFENAPSNIFDEDYGLNRIYATSIAQGLVVLKAQKDPSKLNSGGYAPSVPNTEQKNAKTTYSFTIDDVPYYLVDKNESGVTSTTLRSGYYYAYRNSMLSDSQSATKITNISKDSELKQFSSTDEIIQVYYDADTGKARFRKGKLKQDEDFDISFNNTRVMTIDPEQNFVRSSSDTSTNSLAVSRYYELKYYMSKLTIGSTIFAFDKITRERTYDSNAMTFSYSNFQLNYNSEFDTDGNLGDASKITADIGKTFIYFGENYTINDAYELPLCSDDQNDDRVGAKIYKLYFARTDYGYSRYFLIYNEYTTDVSKASQSYNIYIEFVRLQNTIEISLKEENLYSINTGSTGNSLYIGGMMYEGSTGEIPNYTYNTQYEISKFVDENGNFVDYNDAGANVTVPFEYNTFYEDVGNGQSSFDNTGNNVTYDYKLTSLNWKAYLSYNPSNTIYYQIYATSGYLIKSFNIYVGTPYEYVEGGERYYLQNIVSFEIVEDSAFEKLIYNSDETNHINENYTYTPANDVSPNLIYTINLKHILCDEDGNPILDANGDYQYCDSNGHVFEEDEQSNEHKNSGYTSLTDDGSKVGLWYSNMQGQSWVDYTAQDGSGKYALDDIFLLMSGLYEDIKIDIVTTSFAEMVFEDGDLLVKNSGSYVNSADNYYAYHDIDISDTYLSLYTQKISLDNYKNPIYDENGKFVTELDDRNGLYYVNNAGNIIFDDDGNRTYPYILRYYPNGTEGYTITTPTGGTVTNGGLKPGTIRLIFIGTGSEIKYGLHIFATTGDFSAYFTNARFYNQKTSEVYTTELESGFQPPLYADAFKNLESYSGRTQNDEVIYRETTLNKTNKMAYIYTGEIIKDGQNNYFSDWYNKKISNRVKFFLALSAHENDVSVRTTSYLYNQNLTKNTKDHHEDLDDNNSWISSHGANGVTDSSFKYAFYNNSENEDNKLLSFHTGSNYYTYQLDNKTKTQSWFNNTVLSNIAHITNFTDASEMEETDWIDRDESSDNVSKLENMPIDGFNFLSQYYDIAGYNLSYIMLELGDLTEHFVIDLSTLKYVEEEVSEGLTTYYLVNADEAATNPNKRTISMVSRSGYTFDFSLNYSVYSDGDVEYGYYSLFLFSLERDENGEVKRDDNDNMIIDIFKSVGLMGSNIRISYVSNAENYYVLFDSNTSEMDSETGEKQATRVSTEDEFVLTDTVGDREWVYGENTYRRYLKNRRISYYRSSYQTICYDSLTTIDFTASLPGYTFIGWGSKTYRLRSNERVNRFGFTDDLSTAVTWNSAIDWFDISYYFVSSGKTAFQNAEKFSNIYRESIENYYLPGSAFYVDGGYFMTDTGVSDDNSEYKENYNFYSNYISYFGSNIAQAAKEKNANYFNPIILYAMYKANTYIIEFDVNNETYNDVCYVDTKSEYGVWNGVMLPGNLGFSSEDARGTTTTYVAYVTFDTNNWYYVIKENGADNLYSYADPSLAGSGYAKMYDSDNVSEQIRIDMFGYSWLGWTYSKLDYIDGETLSSDVLEKEKERTVIQSKFSDVKAWKSTAPTMNTDFLSHAKSGEGYVKEIAEEDSQKFNYKNQHITDGWDMVNQAPNDISNGYVYFYNYAWSSRGRLNANVIFYHGNDYLNTYYEESDNNNLDSIKMAYSYYDTCLNKNCYTVEKVNVMVDIDEESPELGEVNAVRYKLKVTKNNNNLRLFKLYANWEQNKYHVYAFSQDVQTDPDNLYKFGSSLINWNNSYSDTDSLKDLGSHYFNNYSLAYKLYYNFRPTRIGYDFEGWTFAYTDDERFASVNSRSDVVYLCSNMLANYGVLYNYSGNSTKRAVNLFIGTGDEGFTMSNSNCETLGDEDAYSGDTRYVYVYPVWKVQSFPINISLNISKEQLKNLHERDSSFALGLYESVTGKTFTGISSKFYTNNTLADSTRYNSTGSNYNDYYSDIVANILFEIDFDASFDTAKLTFGEKTYTLKDLFATSAGYYFLGLMYKSNYTSDEDYIVKNILKSYLTTEGLDYESDYVSDPSFKLDDDDNVQVFNAEFYEKVYYSKLSVSGSTISSSATNQEVMGTDIEDERIGKDYFITGNNGFILSSNFGRIRFSSKVIRESGYAKDCDFNMINSGESINTYYSIMSEVNYGEYYLYVLVNNTKYYVVFYNYDSDNKIDNSLTFDRTFLYYNKTVGSTTYKYTVRFDSNGNAYYVDNSYGNKTSLNLKVAVYKYITNRLYLSATNELVMFNSTTTLNGSLLGVNGSVGTGDASWASGAPTTLYSFSTREFTLYAHWEERKIEASIVNGNNSDITNASKNVGLSGYYGMEATRTTDTNFKQTKIPSVDANTNTDIKFSKETGDELNYYDNLRLNFLPYYNGRYLSEMTFTFDTLDEDKSGSGGSSKFIMKTNTVSIYFAWDNENYSISISNVYLNGGEVYSPFTSSGVAGYSNNKFKDTISILSFLDKFGIGGTTGLELNSYKGNPVMRIISKDGREDTNFVSLKLENLMCNLEISCKFSIQTFKVEIYKLLLTDSEAGSNADKTEFRTIFTSEASLLSASNYNEDNRKVLGEPYQSWNDYQNSNIATVSTDCAHAKVSFNVPYGYYITYDKQPSMPSGSGLEYIYTKGNYYKGNSTVSKISSVYDKALFAFSSSGSLIRWCSYSGVDSSNVILTAYEEEKAIMKNTTIYGLFKNTESNKQVVFYNWDNETESYVQYTNNLAEYTSGGSKFRNGENISELPSSGMAQWYNKDGKQMKFLGYVYISNSDFDTFSTAYKKQMGSTPIITDMFKYMVEPVTGGYSTESKSINGIGVSVLSKATLKINFTSDGSKSTTQEFNVLNVSSVLDDHATTKYYAIPIYSEIELKIDKDKTSYNSGTLQFSTSQFISTVFEYTNKYTIFYDIARDLRFAYTTSTSVSESTLNEYITLGDSNLETSINGVSTTNYYKFYSTTGNKSFVFGSGVSGTIYLFFYYVKPQNSTSVYPFYMSDNCLKIKFKSGGTIESVEVYNVKTGNSESSIEWKFEVPDNYSPIDYDLEKLAKETSFGYNYFLTLARSIDQNPNCSNTYEQYNRKLLMYITLQLYHSGAIEIDEENGYKEFGLNSDSPDNRYGNIEDTIIKINNYINEVEGSEKLKVSSSGFFKLIYCIAFRQVNKYRLNVGYENAIKALNGYFTSVDLSAMKIMSEKTATYNSNDTDAKIKTGDLLKGFNPTKTNEDGKKLYQNDIYSYSGGSSYRPYYSITHTSEEDSLAMFITVEGGQYLIMYYSATSGLKFDTFTPDATKQQNNTESFSTGSSVIDGYYYSITSGSSTVGGRVGSSSALFANFTLRTCTYDPDGNFEDDEVRRLADAMQNFGTFSYIIINGNYYYYDSSSKKYYYVNIARAKPYANVTQTTKEWVYDENGNHLDQDGNVVGNDDSIKWAYIEKTETVKTKLQVLIEEAGDNYATITDINGDVKICNLKGAEYVMAKVYKNRKYAVLQKIVKGEKTYTFVTDKTSADDVSYTETVGGYTFYYLKSTAKTDNGNLWINSDNFYYTRFYSFS